MIFTFARLWLTPVDNPATGYGFRLAADGLESDPQTTVELRAYAGGRMRAVATPGQFEQLPVTLRADNRFEIGLLHSWQGQLLCVRDPKGRKFFAVYTDLKISERAGQSSATVTLTLNEVSYVEAV